MNLKKCVSAVMLIVVTAFCLCSCTFGKDRVRIPHRYASAKEGRELMLSNDQYYDAFSQNDLDFKMQKTGATMDEYKEFAASQVQDFTVFERSFMDP